MSYPSSQAWISLPSPTPPPSAGLGYLANEPSASPLPSLGCTCVSVIDWFSLKTGNALSATRSRGKLDSHKIKMRTTLLKSFRKFPMPNVNNFSKVKHKNYPGNGNTCWPLQKSNRKGLNTKLVRLYQSRTRKAWTQNSFDFTKVEQQWLEHKTRSTLLKSNRKGLNTKLVPLYQSRTAKAWTQFH